MSCCTDDCGCDEEEPPLELHVPEIVIEEGDDDEDEIIIIVDDPEEPEPEVVIEVPEPEVESIPEPEEPAEPVEVEELPVEVKEEIKTELCALPWNMPAKKVEEVVSEQLGLDDEE